MVALLDAEGDTHSRTVATRTISLLLCSCALPVEATERILLANQGHRMKFATRLPFAEAKRVTMGKRYGIVNLIAFGVLALLLGVAAPAAAHPVPFSYLDILIDPDGVNVTLVVHVFDAARELGVDPPERLLDRSVLVLHGDELIALLRSRLQ